METRLRSAVKGVVWTLLGLFTMSLVGSIVTGSATAGGLMAAINSALGFTLYLVYERVWARIRWGRHA